MLSSSHGPPRLPEGRMWLDACAFMPVSGALPGWRRIFLTPGRTSRTLPAMAGGYVRTGKDGVRDGLDPGRERLRDARGASDLGFLVAPPSGLGSVSPP